MKLPRQNKGFPRTNKENIARTLKYNKPLVKLTDVEYQLQLKPKHKRIIQNTEGSIRIYAKRYGLPEQLRNIYLQALNPQTPLQRRLIYLGKLRYYYHNHLRQSYL